MTLSLAPLNMVLHFDTCLPLIIQEYGILTYIILFVILFCETGLVVTPYLPGDSLLFAAGALAGAGLLDIGILLAVLILAAILGDTVNYWIGQTFEMRILTWRFSFVKREHLDKTREYFEKYGGVTIVLGRFMPFIRTFAPFLAGIGKMRYSWFLGYNVMGGIAWVGTFLMAGFLVGNFPLVKQNFSLIISAIIGLSVLAFLPIFFKLMRSVRSHPPAEEREGDG
ncbi:MAG: VTT domain-containing protein [Methanoregula sp.]|nr:VTT domain-containing protein [Methanoregula sp.]